MKKNNLQRGASLIELLVAIGVFTVGVITILFLVFDSGTATRSGATRTQATLLSQEGLEAVRTIRDNDFTTLVDGTYGIALSAGKWILSGTSDITGQFTRIITIAPGTDSFSKKITSSVSWPITPTRNQTITFVEYLTKWNHPPLTQIECFHVDLSGASIEQGSVNKIVRYIWISNPSCGHSIELKKMVLTWNIPGNNLFKVRIQSNFVWQGNVPSGTEITLNPERELISGAPAIEIDQLRWFQSIAGSPIGVRFIMEDGSSQEFTIPAF